ncbi:MAG: hypothetical protein ACO1SX_16380, partial [Actinomycetota bacterium]
MPAALIAGVSGAGALHPERKAARNPQALAAAVPLAFEENLGQTDAQAAFVARGDGYQVFVTPTEAVLKLRSRKGAAKKSPFSKPGAQPIAPAGSAASVLRLGLVDAKADAATLGEGTLPGRAHYLRGGKRSASAATFRRARC